MSENIKKRSVFHYAYLIMWSLIISSAGLWIAGIFVGLFFGISLTLSKMILCWFIVSAIAFIFTVLMPSDMENFIVSSNELLQL